MTTIILFLIPQYTIFIFLAMEAYTISLMNVAVYLDKIDNKNYIFITEISLNLLSALGVYIGRFARLNSWDIFYKPKSVLERLSKIFLEQNTEITIITMFLIFLFFYQWLKYFNLLLIKYYKYYNRQDNLT